VSNQKKKEETGKFKEKFDHRWSWDSSKAVSGGRKGTSWGRVVFRGGGISASFQGKYSFLIDWKSRRGSIRQEKRGVNQEEENSPFSKERASSVLAAETGEGGNDQGFTSRNETSKNSGKKERSSPY